jgi:hypothetical protein
VAGLPDFCIEYRELAIQPLTKHPDLDCTRLHQGTLVHNHAFNRLEYLIWKVNQSGVEAGALKLDSEITKQFRFAFRSSVEHHFPRRPDSDMDLEWANQGMLKNGLHDFGNLCLISHQTNSSLNNALPEDKRRKVLKSKTIESLKQRLMIQAKAWGETEEGIDEICNHREAVIALLKQRTECVGC